MYSIRHIKELTESFNKESSIKIEEKINNNMPEEKVRLSVSNIFILFNEIVSSHPEILLYKLNVTS